MMYYPFIKNIRTQLQLKTPLLPFVTRIPSMQTKDIKQTSQKPSANPAPRCVNISRAQHKAPQASTRAHAARQQILCPKWSLLLSSASSAWVQHSDPPGMILGPTPSPWALTLPSIATHISTLTLVLSCCRRRRTAVPVMLTEAHFSLWSFGQKLSHDPPQVERLQLLLLDRYECELFMAFIRSWWGCSSILPDTSIIKLKCFEDGMRTHLPLSIADC